MRKMAVGGADTTSGEAFPSAARRRRPSASSLPSATETVLGVAKQAEAAAERALLVLWEELPEWRRDNVYLRSGYRATSNSVAASLASLAYLHNESVNIWTHLLGAAAAVLIAAAGLVRLVAARFDAAGPADRLVFFCFFAGAVLCLGMSATYHALCNHSDAVSKWGNKLDYSGIVLLVVGSFVPALYYGFFCRPALMAVYLYMISLLGLGCLVVSWFEHFRLPKWRPYRALMFVGLGLSGIVPVIHGLALDSYQHLEERMGLSWVLLQGVLYILGAFLYAIRWPERAFPGRFDIWGSSHQIFHVLILLAAASHLYAMAKAFDYHHGVMGGSC